MDHSVGKVGSWGRWFWVILWSLGGAMFALIAALIHNWASLIPLVVAGWLFYSAWRAQRAATFIVRDALGREVHRSRRSGV
jgi:hypothetical protein